MPRPASGLLPIGWITTIQRVCKEFHQKAYTKVERRALFPELEDESGNNINGTVLSTNNETELRNTPTAEGKTFIAREPPPIEIVYPWSISYRGLMHYQTPRGSLDYVDFNGRSRIRGIPQFGEFDI